MRIPKQRIRFARTYESQNDPGGYLILDLKGLDLEGVTTLVIAVGEAEDARASGDRQEEARKRVQDLLGG